MGESRFHAIADGADAGRGFKDCVAVLHVGRGDHLVDYVVRCGEETFEVHVAEFIDHPLDVRLTGLFGIGLL